MALQNKSVSEFGLDVSVVHDGDSESKEHRETVRVVCMWAYMCVWIISIITLLFIPTLAYEWFWSGYCYFVSYKYFKIPPWTRITSLLFYMHTFACDQHNSKTWFCSNNVLQQGREYGGFKHGNVMVMRPKCSFKRQRHCKSADIVCKRLYEY